MDALDVRLCEIADQCKTEGELMRLQALIVLINVWRSETGNVLVKKTVFTYELFMNDMFGALRKDIGYPLSRFEQSKLRVKSGITEAANSSGR